MAVTGTEPISAENLGAAIGAGEPSEIGVRPVSVDNLKAALDAKEAAAPMVLLYDGPATTVAKLSQDLSGFDYYIAEIKNVSTGGYGVLTSSVDNHFKYPSGYMAGTAQVNGTSNVWYIIGNDFTMDRNDGYTISSSKNITGNIVITRVFGVRFKS